MIGQDRHETFRTQRMYVFSSCLQKYIDLVEHYGTVYYLRETSNACLVLVINVTHALVLPCCVNALSDQTQYLDNVFSHHRYGLCSQAFAYNIPCSTRFGETSPLKWCSLAMKLVFLLLVMHSKGEVTANEQI